MLNTESSAQAYKLPFYYYLFIFFLLAHSTSEDTSLTEKHVSLKFVRVFKIPLPSKGDFCTCSELLIESKSFLFVFQRIPKKELHLPCPPFLPPPPPHNMCTLVQAAAGEAG